MIVRLPLAQWSVHCRTGSLEIHDKYFQKFPDVHCRTGSLEMAGQGVNIGAKVHCRTGSLEIR